MQQKMYTYTVNSLKSISVLNLIVFVFWSLSSFATSFQARVSPIYLHNVNHNASYISLYYLTISRLKWKKQSCFQLQCAVVAWSRWSLFYYYYYPCVCVASVQTCEMKTQEQMKAHENSTFFHFLRWRLRLCQHLR